MGPPPSTKTARRLQLICKVLFIVQGLAVARTLLGLVMSLFSGYLSSMLWLSLVNLLFPALLLIGTAMVMERSNQRYAWVAVVILTGLTPLLFTGYSPFGSSAERTSCSAASVVPRYVEPGLLRSTYDALRF
jgi:hypothetical protein